MTASRRALATLLALFAMACARSNDRERDEERRGEENREGEQQTARARQSEAARPSTHRRKVEREAELREATAHQPGNDTED